MAGQRRDKPANANLLGKFHVNLTPGRNDEPDPDEGEDADTVVRRGKDGSNGGEAEKPTIE